MLVMAVLLRAFGRCRIVATGIAASQFGEIASGYAIGKQA
jgi:hypothetical protein